MCLPRWRSAKNEEFHSNFVKFQGDFSPQFLTMLTSLHCWLKLNAMLTVTEWLALAWVQSSAVQKSIKYRSWHLLESATVWRQSDRYHGTKPCRNLWTSMASLKWIHSGDCRQCMIIRQQLMQCSSRPKSNEFSIGCIELHMTWYTAW